VSNPGETLTYSRQLRLLPDGAVISNGRPDMTVWFVKTGADQWRHCDNEGAVVGPRNDTFQSEAVFLPAKLVSTPAKPAVDVRRTKVARALVDHSLQLWHSAGVVCACTKTFSSTQEHVDHQADAVMAELAKEH
jgi:hypothetical protein